MLSGIEPYVIGKSITHLLDGATFMGGGAKLTTPLINLLIECLSPISTVNK